LNVKEALDYKLALNIISVTQFVKSSILLFETAILENFVCTMKSWLKTWKKFLREIFT